MNHKYIENTYIIKFHLRNYLALGKRKYWIQMLMAEKKIMNTAPFDI